jgi:hypothetical protein
MEDEYALTYSASDIDNYVMYKIYPKNSNLNYCYIGHTNNFNFRKRHHRLPCIDINHSKSHIKLYQVIRENGGWDEWEMVELEKFNGKTKLEARMREQELMKIHNANLNMLNAYITEDERKATKNAITEKYREENKEKIRQQEKKYKEDHKEIIAEQMKKYRAENKDKINQKTREYRENNKEKHQEWQRIWREKNKESLKEKRKLYDAKKKEEKLAQMALSESSNSKLTPEEEQLKKEQHKKEKRDQYNATRRLKRLQEKQNNNQSQIEEIMEKDETII